MNTNKFPKRKYKYLIISDLTNINALKVIQNEQPMDF